MSADTSADNKILVIGPSWVGDMVLAQSLFKVLKQQNPAIAIDVAAPGWTLPLLERMPEINEAIPLPFSHGKLDLGKRIKIGRSLKRRGYSQAILLTNSMKSGLVPFSAHIPKRTGFLGEYRYGLLNDIRPLDKQKLPRTVDRFVALGLQPEQPLPTSIPAPQLIPNNLNALLALQRLARPLPTTRVLGLCPGAEYGPAKRWPADYYSEVACAVLERGWEVWLFGSQKDTEVTASINEQTKNKCTDFGGKTSLGEAVDLMSLTHTVVSNDSGLMHVAAALGKKVISIFGSSDPYHTPPMNKEAIILYLGLDCSPCFERECPLGHLNCLKAITPQLVIQSSPDLSRTE
ncbi:MAG TPA: lipopolysaccharide heptosyltransferase II [Methylophilaceae bacterium]|nr:lipopolysaccharide heptosyltransferase II [Methylophilaceae bacterium]